jgi:hypothetical protein
MRNIGSGATDRPGRDSLLKAARHREVRDVIAGRLDDWGSCDATS